MISFPPGFVWGVATSAFQIEGAARVDGKGPSIWDAFCSIPGRIEGGHLPDVAADHYAHYREDVAQMARLGFKAYRFSISWPRVLPQGSGAVNEAGIRFYSDLIDELLAAGIEPWVTLYHWDLPLALQLGYDGWLNPRMADYYLEYADLCFRHFGDRVKNWITFNEPWVIGILGHGQGVFAPGRVSNREPYLVGHHLLLAHARAAELYRSRYGYQQGRIGITNNCDWREPLSNAPEDREAAERALQFFLGWFADPIWLGDYPDVMKKRLGDRLPAFTMDEKSLLKDSADFFGLNHYTAMYAAQACGPVQQGSVFGNGGLSEDQDVQLSVSPDWKQTTLGWAVTPWGCGKLLHWIAGRYGNPPVYITENGATYHDRLHDGRVVDAERMAFFQSYLSECRKAIAGGVNLKGYFAWCLLDTFEWTWGYNQKFGLLHVDFETRKRTPKASALWFKKAIAANSADVDPATVYE
jgi:beta-galactosidase